MSNMPFAEYAASVAKACPKLSVGLHLTLTEGKPLSVPADVDNLIDSNGNFIRFSPQRKNLRSNEVAKRQVYKELEAQLIRAMDLGVNISHFDSHHFIHRAPIVRKAIIKLHKLYGVPAIRAQKGLYFTDSKAKFCFKLKRMELNLRKYKKKFSQVFQDIVVRRSGLLTPDSMLSPGYLIPLLSDPKEQFIQFLKAVPEGVYELMLHPGYYDEGSGDSEEFKKTREFDANIAIDEDIKNCIRECGIRLISFNELGKKD
jgi:predicted glycoside hydrolase/deacetylase ChbG (UPF0249 family)